MLERLKARAQFNFGTSRVQSSKSSKIGDDGQGFEGHELTTQALQKGGKSDSCLRRWIRGCRFGLPLAHMSEYLLKIKPFDRHCTDPGHHGWPVAEQASEVVQEVKSSDRKIERDS